jgi:hypothetical protein
MVTSLGRVGLTGAGIGSSDDAGQRRFLTADARNVTMDDDKPAALVAGDDEFRAEPRRRREGVWNCSDAEKIASIHELRELSPTLRMDNFSSVRARRRTDHSAAPFGACETRPASDQAESGPQRGPVFGRHQ